MKYDTQSWKEGYDAAARGVASHKSPYTPGDKWALAWRAGYDTRNCDGGKRYPHERAAA